MTPNKIKKTFLKNENFLFFQRLIKNPRALGAVAPSSRRLARLICQQVVRQKDDYVIEIGAGTGSFTRQLLASGVSPSHLIVIELDKELCAFMQKKFPEVRIIQGNACDLENLVPKQIIGKISTIVSGIPMVNLSYAIRKSIVDSCFSVMKPGGQLLQFTYGPMSPLASKKMNLSQKRIGYVFMNVPPATVWKYQKQVSTHHKNTSSQWSQYRLKLHCKILEIRRLAINGRLKKLTPKKK